LHRAPSRLDDIFFDIWGKLLIPVLENPGSNEAIAKKLLLPNDRFSGTHLCGENAVYEEI
jgi:hypothetical protein